MNASEFLTSSLLELKDIDSAALTPDLTLEELALDSLDYVEIQVGIKKHFGVDVQTDLFSSGAIKTLGELTTYIETHTASKPAPLPA